MKIRVHLASELPEREIDMWEGSEPRRKVFFCIYLMVLLSITGILQATADDAGVYRRYGDPVDSRNASCGPSCLLEALLVSGIPCEATTVFQVFPDPSREHTLLDLFEACEVLGLSAYGLTIQDKQPSEIRPPAIAAVSGEHFVLVKRVTDETVLFYDPGLYRDRSLPGKDFQSYWTGPLLLIRNPRKAFQGISPMFACDSLMFDYGDTYEGEAVNARFLIRNIGCRVLEISDVASSCSCSLAQLSSRAIAPNATSELIITHRTKSLSGLDVQRIRLGTNDPCAPEVFVHIRGNVIREFTYSPKELSLGNVTAWPQVPAASGEIQVVDLSSDESVTLLSVACDDERFLIETMPTTDFETKDGAKHRLFAIRASLKDGAFNERSTTVERIHASIGIELTSVVDPKITIPVDVTFIPEIFTAPAQIIFGGTRRESTELVRRAKIVPQKGQRLNVKRTYSTNKDISVGWVRSGESVVVEAKLNAKTAPHGESRGFVVVETDSERFPEIRIPVEGFVMN